MRRHLLWLAWGVLSVCALIAQPGDAHAQTVQPVKPYVLFILDVSGSMDGDTGFGVSSCGGSSSRLHHAKCAIQNIAAAYGEMVMGLGRFRQTSVDVTPADGCGMSGVDCSGAWVASDETGDRLEVVVPIVDGNQSDLISWTNFSQNVCTCVPGTAGCDSADTVPSGQTPNPEFFSGGYTPNAGSMRGAKFYWQGADSPTQGPYWTGTGDDPIVDDPLNTVFPVPGGPQCRPYITIMMTDGDETCADSIDDGPSAAASMLSTIVDIDPTAGVNNQTYRIETKPIGFGKPRNDLEIEAIAHAGGAVDEGYCGTADATACNENSDCTAPAICNYAADTTPPFSSGLCTTVTATFCDSNADCTMPAVCNFGGITEGAYAQNEEELQLEISAIIADAIKFETCNDLDDDCDGLIDEDFRPPLDATCDDGDFGICRDTGVYVCNLAETGVECNAVDAGDMPTGEVCNGLDDDCNGFVDDGISCSCGTIEFCNGLDDDCDGIADNLEGITQPCGTDIGVCAPGVETCNWDEPSDPDPQWIGCTADPLPGELTETCNRCDDDCDGTVDGFAQPCSDLPGGINPDTGLCHYGTQTCPTSAPGVCPTPSPFGACIGEVVPDTEVCDLQDNDCDDIIDEDTGGADCSSACGIGTTVCDMGVLECSSVTLPTDDTCNNLDDNCNGEIDENAPPGGTCMGGANDGDLCGIGAIPTHCPGGTCVPGCDGPPGLPGTICMGTAVCAGGNYVCLGEGIEPEICNCEDDDCNAVVDEGMLCSPGSTCVDPATAGFACQCAQPCQAGEFPCGIGEVCLGGFCLVDPCFGVTCIPDGNGDATECAGGTCERICDTLNCPSPLICFGPTGECAPDDCTTFPDRCASDELCIGGTCVNDPCATVTCGGAEYCFDGDCYGSCAGVDCPDGQRCVLGSCEPDPCGAACPSGQVCDEDDMVCDDDPCPNQMCPQGEWCNPQNGICEQDPCAGVECPGEDEICIGGTCFGPDHFVDGGSVDANPDEITTGGGGGCGDAGGGGGGLGLAALVIGIALAVRRRRRAVEVAS